MRNILLLCCCFVGFLFAKESLNINSEENRRINKSNIVDRIETEDPSIQNEIDLLRKEFEEQRNKIDIRYNGKKERLKEQKKQDIKRLKELFKSKIKRLKKKYPKEIKNIDRKKVKPLDKKDNKYADPREFDNNTPTKIKPKKKIDNEKKLNYEDKKKPIKLK